jgi:hypothetical protein
MPDFVGMDRATIVVVPAVRVSEGVTDGVSTASPMDPIGMTTWTMNSDTGCGPVIIDFPEPVVVTRPFEMNPTIALAS